LRVAVVARGTPPGGRPVSAQVLRFVLVGVGSTALNAVLFYGLRTWWEPVPASAVSLVLSTAFSTEAHRRFTFTAPDVRRWRVHAQSVGTIVFYAWYSAAVLAVLHVLVAEPTPMHETLSIAGASAFGGVTRFLLLRSWAFAPGPDGPSRVWAGVLDTVRHRASP
jgi:putative flippase GtrA